MNYFSGWEITSQVNGLPEDLEMRLVDPAQEMMMEDVVVADLVPVVSSGDAEIG